MKSKIRNTIKCALQLHTKERQLEFEAFIGMGALNCIILIVYSIVDLVQLSDNKELSFLLNEELISIINYYFSHRLYPNI